MPLPLHRPSLLFFIIIIALHVCGVMDFILIPFFFQIFYIRLRNLWLPLFLNCWLAKSALDTMLVSILFFLLEFCNSKLEAVLVGETREHDQNKINSN